MGCSQKAAAPENHYFDVKSKITHNSLEKRQRKEALLCVREDYIGAI